MQTWKLYQVSGNKLERKNKFCPKCGERLPELRKLLRPEEDDQDPDDHRDFGKP